MRLLLAAFAAISISEAYDVSCRTRNNNFLGNSNSGCWLEWSGWSECLGTCGKGIKTASRKCRDGNGFAIAGITPGCSGSDVRRRPCAASTQPASQSGDSCAYWSFWSEWSTCTLNTGAHYCDKSRFFGRETRTRVCNDPEAAIRGIAPRCAPDALTQVTDREERSCSDTSTAVCNPMDFMETSYGACETECGNGMQCMDLRHKCLDYTDTWVSPTCLYDKRYNRKCRMCKKGCCPTEWSEWKGTPSPCGDYQVTRSRSQNATCQYENQIQLRTVDPPPAPCSFQDDLVGWNGCMPQPAAWNPQILTTCGGNGIQIRTCEHMCVKYPQHLGGCAYGDKNCKWLQTPWSYQQSKQCGEIERPCKIEITCDPSGCRPAKCEKVCGCEGDWRSFTREETTCPPTMMNECQRSKPNCALPSETHLYTDIPPCTTNSCGCGDSDQIFRSTKCGEVREERIPCPAHGEECLWQQWTYSETLRAALYAGKCICKNALDDSNKEYRYQICETSAGNGEICSRYEKTSTKESRISLRAADKCPQVIPGQCPIKECLGPFEDPKSIVRIDFELDLCTNTRTPYGEAKPCLVPPPCCTWGPWINDACPTTIACPGMAPTVTRRRQNSCPDQFPEEIEVTGIKCPASCPVWPQWGEWSECNNIIEDGTHCGGHRSRVRDYPCRQDVMNGLCPPPSSWGQQMQDFFTSFDTPDVRRHSSHCYQLMLSDVSRMVYTSWSAWEIDTERPCDWNKDIRMVRRRYVSDKCVIDGENIEEVEYESRPAGECRENPETAQCVLDASRCKILYVQYECIASDACGVNEVKTRPPMAGECDTVLRENRPPPIESRTPCMDRNDPMDVCSGKIIVRNTDYCTKEYSEYEMECTNPPEWGSWSEYENIPVEESWTRSTGIYYNRDIIPDMSKCNICGGSLISVRRMKCGNTEQVEYRTVECPIPRWYWSQYEPECPPCYSSQAENPCMKQRRWITEPAAMHCPCTPPSGARECPVPEVMKQPLQPCKNVVFDYTHYCQHNTDVTANCGEGIIKTRQVIKTVDYFSNKVDSVQFKDHQFYFTHARNGSRTDLLASAPDSQKVIRMCNLSCQIVPVVSEWSACPLCGGGQSTQVTEFECRNTRNPRVNIECRPPHGKIDQEPIIKYNACPPTPTVAVSTEWVVNPCGECQTMTLASRTCENGVFEQSNTLNNYFRTTATNDCTCGKCCLQEDGTDLVRRGYEIVEQKEVVCPNVVQDPVDCVIVESDIGCECGWCPTEKVCKNRCNGMEVSRTPDEPIYRAFNVIESLWSACLYGPEKCNIRDTFEYFGYQNRTITGECISNRLNRIPRVETRDQPDCRITVENLPPVEGPCISGQCTRTVTYSSWCDRQPFFEPRIEMVPCGSESWTMWSSCTAECGTGSRTRHLVKDCALSEYISTEVEPCEGCPYSDWGPWSEWQNERDVCRQCIDDQSVQRVRTCLHPKSTAYNQVLRSAWGYNGNFNGGSYYRSSSSSYGSCFNKCNRCDGPEYEAQQFNWETYCPGNITTTTYPIECPVCPTPTSKQTKTTYKCGKIIGTVDIACRMEQRPVEIIESECSVLCGMGTKQVTYRQDCVADRIETAPCQGPYGRIVPDGKVSEWSECSVQCGGGSKTRKSTLVCELEPSIVVEAKVESNSCNLSPCAYWGGWTEFGLCSVTCGSGVRQRFRQCIGGNPSPFDRVNGDTNACGGSSIEATPCVMGDCCDYPWSGWTDCCQENNERKRLRWRGYNANNNAQCSGSFEEIIEACGSYQIDRPMNDLQQCELLRARKTEGTTTTYTYAVIYDGVYTTNAGLRYEVMNGKWFRLSPYGGRIEINVEKALSDVDKTYIYKLGGVWYKFNNGQLFQTTYSYPVEQTLTKTMTFFGFADSGTYTIGDRKYELYIDNDRPVWSLILPDGTSEKATSIQEKQHQNEWYYQIDNIWYRYVKNFDGSSGRFDLVSVLPWIEITSTNTNSQISSYVVKDPAGSGLTTGVEYKNNNAGQYFYNSNSGINDNTVISNTRYLPPNGNQMRAGGFNLWG